MEENLAALKEAIYRFFLHRPTASIILTVDPVATDATFDNVDVITRSFLAKCQLRVVAEEICQAFPGKVFYFPSLEMVLAYNPHALLADNRHVKAKIVDRIMATLFNSIITKQSV